jgi:Sec-independent protein translocase protein TatA
VASKVIGSLSLRRIEGSPMEFLGIGPLELLFIILIALLILGPKDLEKTGKSIGKGLSKLVKSDTWKTVRQASERVKSLPNELMREAGMEDMKKSLSSEILPSEKNTQEILDSRENESRIIESADPEIDTTKIPSSDPNRIAPPAPKDEK